MNSLYILGIASACWLVYVGFILGFFSMKRIIEKKYKNYLSRDMTNFLLSEQKKRLKSKGSEGR
ncbi:hypothetical protein KY314_05225 [Candidatus Woesearchaeota archaeon]|nr:hypothetical protein [Candidatus Woesearchaeota archaeon]